MLTLKKIKIKLNNIIKISFKRMPKIILKNIDINDKMKKIL